MIIIIIITINIITFFSSYFIITTGDFYRGWQFVG